jgi:hypothetical protein
VSLWLNSGVPATEVARRAGHGAHCIDGPASAANKRYESWYRYVTLAMLALAFLAVTRGALADGGAGLASSANEIRRMLTALCEPPPDEQHARRWSRWRHRHQERSRRCHYQRQQLQDH